MSRKGRARRHAKWGNKWSAKDLINPINQAGFSRDAKATQSIKEGVKENGNIRMCKAFGGKLTDDKTQCSLPTCGR